MEEKKISIYGAKSGYMPFEGVLEEVKLIQTVFEDKERSYTTIKLSNGEIRKVYDNKLYASVEDYKNDKPIPMKEYNEDDICFMNVPRACQFGLELRYWRMKDGFPEQSSWKVEKYVYDYIAVHFALFDSIVGSRLYSSREECLSFNEIVSVDADGKTTTHVGINRKLMLDEDQQELMKKLRGVIEECENNGIYFLMDCCDHLSVYNTRHVSGHEMADNQCFIDAEDREKYERSERYAPEFDSGIYVNVWGEDYDLWAKE